MAKHKVGTQDDFPRGQAKACTVAGLDLAVYALSNGYYATQARCTHLMGPLAQGKIIDDRLIQCPRHHARFDIRTGEVMDWANFPSGHPGVQSGAQGKGAQNLFGERGRRRPLRRNMTRRDFPRAWMRRLALCGGRSRS